jgi:hypothetical protein
VLGFKDGGLELGVIENPKSVSVVEQAILDLVILARLSEVSLVLLVGLSGSLNGCNKGWG